MAAASWLQPCIFCGMRRYGDTEIRRGTLERVPRTPPELSSNCIWLKPGGGEGVSRADGGGGHGGIDSPCRRCPGVRLARLVACLPCLWFAFLPPIPPPPFPGGEGGRLRLFFMQGASPLASPGAGRDAALKVGGMRRPAGACPGRHRQVNSGSPNPAEAAKPILQHPTSQPPCRSAGEGRNRARTPDPINHNLFGKVLGGLGDSFKSPPALPTSPPRLPALPRASMRKSKRRRRFFFADCRQAGENVL